MKIRFLSLLALAFFAFACGDSASTTGEAAADKAEEMMEEAKEMMAEGAVKLSPMPATQGFPDAMLKAWTYENGTFNYTVENYAFAAQTPDAESLMCANSGKGQHAHLIVNNEPYMAKYEPTFDVDLPDGTHHIMTFLSRSYHEAIKNGTAHRAVVAEVKDKSFASVEDITEPMLFYSRPKGKYTGKANTENIMLDFYPVNAELSEEGFYVEAVVNGGEPMKITKWQPYFLTGLPMGENTVKLSLMKDGALVEAPLNPV
ncbi:MAG: hypothetical protein AAF597_14320, partial [Bacteroidota bacterium]